MESADQDGMTPKEAFFEVVRDAFDISSGVEELLDRYYVDYPACYTLGAGTVQGLRQLRAPRLADRGRHKRRANTAGEAASDGSHR